MEQMIDHLIDFNRGLKIPDDKSITIYKIVFHTHGEFGQGIDPFRKIPGGDPAG